MSDPTPDDPSRAQPVPLGPFPDRYRLGASWPTPLTSFVGREYEVTAVCALLRCEHVRLVTLPVPAASANRAWRRP